MWTEQVSALIAQTEGQIGLLVKDMRSGEILFANNADLVFPSCSLIKLPILLTLMDEAAAGRVDLAQTAPLIEAEAVGGCGLIRHLSRSLPLSYRDYAVFMITVSDNDATNKLITLLGMDRINTRIRELGMRDTVLGRKMMDFEAKRQGKDNFTSCRDLLAVFDCFYSRPERYEDALHILKQQQINNMLSGVLDLDAFEFAHKTGDLPRVRHDIGIMYLKEPIFIAFMSKELRTETDGHRLANEIGALIYEHYKNPGE